MSQYTYEILVEFVRQLAFEECEGLEPELDAVIYRARDLWETLHPDYKAPNNFDPPEGTS